MPLRKNFGSLAGHVHQGQLAMKHELARIGNDIIRHAISYLDTNDVNFQGDLKKSIDKEVDELMGQVKMRVFAGARHAAPVHEGTRPHWPPRRPIENWARRKLKVMTREFPPCGHLKQGTIGHNGTPRLQALPPLCVVKLPCVHVDPIVA